MFNALCDFSLHFAIFVISAKIRTNVTVAAMCIPHVALEFDYDKIIIFENILFQLLTSDGSTQCLTVSAVQTRKIRYLCKQCRSW